MENILIKFDESASELKELVGGLKNYIGDTAVSKKVRDGFFAFYKSVGIYGKATESGDLDGIASAAKNVAVNGLLIGQGLSQSPEVNDQIKSMALDLQKKSNEYRRLVENSPLEYKPINSENHIDNSYDIRSYNTVKANLKRLSDAHLDHDQRIKKLLAENDKRIGDLTVRVKEISDATARELKNITALYEETQHELESKKNQINDILGHVSGRVIAGDFETSAAEEKSMANILRYASLGCMVLIIIVVGYSFWETTTKDFQWQSSVFRVVLAIMFSVPAAYLARESAKHREQQYSHLQTALDLKAITPYVASLPEEEQHRIKIEIASKLFAARDFSSFSKDSYPINIQEIVMEIIKKLEISNPNTKKSGG